MTDAEFDRLMTKAQEALRASSDRASASIHALPASTDRTIGLHRHPGVQSAIETVAEAIEELPRLELAEDAEDWLDELAEGTRSLDDTVFAEQRDRVVRRLRCRLRELPRASAIRRERAATARVLELDQRAPSCPRCAARMTARQGPDLSWFWGCSTFPACWGKRSLSRHQRSALSEETTTSPQESPRVQHPMAGGRSDGPAPAQPSR